MNKTFLIIQREYITRVKKKSFVIMTIVGPLLMAAIMILPMWLSHTDEDNQYIQVIDETGMFINQIPETDNIKFSYSSSSDLQKEKSAFYQKEYTALLYIPKTVAVTTHGIQFYYKKQPGFASLRHIESALEQKIESEKLLASGIDENIIKSIKTRVKIITIGIDETGEEEKSFTELNMVVGLFGGILIYIFIFLYGSLVMRGVIEEKTSRIVEVIISSVKPFQLMLGKIIGVAMVGLTQFLLWIILTFGIFSAATTLMWNKKYDPEKVTNIMSETMIDKPGMKDKDLEKLPEINEIMEVIGAIDLGIMISAFLFYFLGGYLLYSAFFAAIGAAVDNEADTQQFILPITVPLVFAFISAQIILKNPEGSLAFWLSMIPLTSPVVMMVRIPFGVPYWEIGLSMLLLVLGFIVATWLAAKIYRTGILMYGKKVTYKELWKWLSY